MNFLNIKCLLIGSLFFFQISVSAQTAKKPIKAPYFSEEHAISCIEDYFEFYNADESYRNPKYRRIQNNVFYVSLKTCYGGESICYTQEQVGILDPIYIKVPRESAWSSKVLVLTITSKTKYTIKEKYNPRF